MWESDQTSGIFCQTFFPNWPILYVALTYWWDLCCFLEKGGYDHLMSSKWGSISLNIKEMEWTTSLTIIILPKYHIYCTTVSTLNFYLLCLLWFCNLRLPEWGTRLWGFEGMSSPQHGLIICHSHLTQDSNPPFDNTKIADWWNLPFLRNLLWWRRIQQNECEWVWTLQLALIRVVHFLG